MNVNVVGIDSHNGDTVYNATYASYQTNAAGEFTTDVCTYGGAGTTYEVVIQVEGNNSRVRMTQDLGSQVSYACGGTADVVVDTNWSHVFRELTFAADSAAVRLGLARSQVYVAVDPTITVQGYYYPDQIVMKNLLYPGDAFLVGAHELGHALHEETMGGLAPYAGCPNSYADENNLTCAFVEGLAEYIAIATVATRLPNYVTPFEAGTFVAIGEDGAIVPFGVTSFLWDLSDSATELHDSVNFSYAYIFDVITTCEWYHSSVGWYKRTGVDHLIWCFENGVDGNAASVYFGARLADTYHAFHPSSYREFASEPGSWSAAIVRSAWLGNLYK